MKTKSKLLWLALLTSLVLLGSTWMITANADDTYNFYFQKAPGPTTVNQGGAPAKAVDATAAAAAASAPAPATGPTAASSSSVAAADESSTGARTMEIGLGMSNSSFGTDSDTPYVHATSGMLNKPQYYAGVQFNFNDYFGVQTEIYRLTSTPTAGNGPHKVNSAGSLWDFGASLAITPIRLKAFGSSALALTVLVGGITVPSLNNAGAYSGDPHANPSLAHSGSLVYGARAALEISRRVALQASLRRISRFSATQESASVALLF